MPPDDCLSANDKLTLIVSIASAIVAVISAFISKAANKTSQGSLELSLRQAISSSQLEVYRTSIDLAQVKRSEPNGDHKLRESICRSAVESNLNCYENACSLYLDNKVDKIRFKKTYFNEIRDLVNNPHLNEKYFNPTNSQYRAILAVNEIWNNLEK